MDERPDESEKEVEATIYLGQQKPTVPYKRSPYARPLRPSPNPRQDQESDVVSDIVLVPKLPKEWAERLRARQGLPPLPPEPTEQA